ncbi:hypothetical protein D9619_011266 [Psilocybe cf. subviscida]|uniref:Uncharacterized protein n=1 Tax=Psilocybe cf. subviscida TaxID=2480587 RepID=A0A8H5F5H9_9AGAR|nr:hypothetical protein D9619_011266 [Psilocybe cf. subviscida]
MKQVSLKERALRRSDSLQLRLLPGGGSCRGRVDHWQLFPFATTSRLHSRRSSRDDNSRNLIRPTSDIHANPALSTLLLCPVQVLAVKRISSLPSSTALPTAAARTSFPSHPRGGPYHGESESPVSRFQDPFQSFVPLPHLRLHPFPQRHRRCDVLLRTRSISRSTSRNVFYSAFGREQMEVRPSRLTTASLPLRGGPWTGTGRCRQ